MGMVLLRFRGGAAILKGNGYARSFGSLRMTIGEKDGCLINYDVRDLKSFSYAGFRPRTTRSFCSAKRTQKHFDPGRPEGGWDTKQGGRTALFSVVFAGLDPSAKPQDDKVKSWRSCVVWLGD